jgi:hypothetical protein
MESLGTGVNFEISNKARFFCDSLNQLYSRSSYVTQTQIRIFRV